MLTQVEISSTIEYHPRFTDKHINWQHTCQPTHLHETTVYTGNIAASLDTNYSENNKINSIKDGYAHSNMHIFHF